MGSSTPPNRARQALLIVDHGTRSAAANAPLAELARKLAEARPLWLVAHAHMELAEPDFDSAIDGLIARGAEEILIHLHFLGEGFHVRETLPRLIADARERHADVPIQTSVPLGQDSRIAEIVLDRMDAQSPPERQIS